MRDSVWSRTLPPQSREALLASDQLPATADVVVVGSGLVGLCIALELHRRRSGRVVVVDRTSVCGGASGASAGGLWPAHECLTLAEPAIARRASDAHVRLRAEFPCDYSPSGLLSLVGEDAIGSARERVERTKRAGFEAELVSGPSLAECEPSLRHAGAAVRFPGDGSLHPLKLAAGMAGRLRAEGVRICLNAHVRRIEPAGPALITDAGRVSAATVVVAAGAWTPQLLQLLGWEPPIRPIRGALLATDARPPATLRSIVVGPLYYYWQLACGPVAAGGSEEDVGFEEGVDASVDRSVRASFGALFPSLRDLAFTCRWSGFRPMTEDMQPVIGPVPGCAGVFVSAGHFRKGILLAPLSAELLADEIIDGRRCGLAAAFRPERFGRPQGGAAR